MSASAQDLAEAARAALNAGDFQYASAQVRASLALQDLPEAHEVLGALLYLDDEFAAAQEQWQIAFRGLRETGRLKEASRIAIGLAGLHSIIYGHESAASGWVERARRLLERVGECVEWGYLELACFACERTDLPQLLHSTDRALSIAVQFGDHTLEAQALADKGLALVSQGRVSEGFLLLDASLAVISAGDVAPNAVGLCFCSMLTACDRASDVRRAEEWTAIVRSITTRQGGRPKALHTHCSVAMGSVLTACGRWHEAEELMLQARGELDRPTLSHRSSSAAHLAWMRVEQGRLEEAEDLLQPYEDRVTSCAPLSRLHLRRGRPDLAAVVAQRGIAELKGDALRCAPLLATLVEAQLALDDLDAARAVSDQLCALASQVDINVIKAQARSADAYVLAASGRSEEAFEAFDQAQVYLADGERPYELGLLRLARAQLAAAEGDAALATVEARAALACFTRLGVSPARDRAAALLRSLGEFGRPVLQDAPSRVRSLTHRETEVLALLADGLTNGAIADRLYLSKKTVEHHVGRILAKLQVRSRAEAAALAARIGVR